MFLCVKVQYIIANAFFQFLGILLDEETLSYLRLTGRSSEQVDLIKMYLKAQGLFFDEFTVEPIYAETLTLDLGTIEPSVAGPKRPQDRISLRHVKTSFLKLLTAPALEQGFGIDTSMSENVKTSSLLSSNGKQEKLSHGSVVIAAITSCTNTSNPSVMLVAGLLAKNAVEQGLTVPKYVKTSLGPCSRVVTRYLERAGLLASLEQLGFHVV